MKQYSETISADGDGAVYAVRKTGHAGNEPVGFVAAGTFGGGTVTVEVATDTETPVYGAVPNASWTAEVGDKLEMPQGCYFKFVVAGSSGATITLDLSGNITRR